MILISFHYQKKKKKRNLVKASVEQKCEILQIFGTTRLSFLEIHCGRKKPRML